MSCRISSTLPSAIAPTTGPLPPSPPIRKLTSPSPRSTLPSRASASPSACKPATPGIVTSCLRLQTAWLNSGRWWLDRSTRKLAHRSLRVWQQATPSASPFRGTLSRSSTNPALAHGVRSQRGLIPPTPAAGSSAFAPSATMACNWTTSAVEVSLLDLLHLVLHHPCLPVHPSAPPVHPLPA